MSSAKANPTSEPLVFDRRKANHSLESALQELEASQDASAPAHRALAENWRMDWRVSPEREEEALGFPPLRATADRGAFLSALFPYFKRRLCLPSVVAPGKERSAYLAEPNSSNAIAPGTVSPHDQLLHAASLSRLLRLVEPPKDELFPARFQRDVGVPFPARAVGAAAMPLPSLDDLAERLNAGGPDTVRNAVGSICRAIERDPGFEQEPPWWATFAQGVYEHVAEGNGTGLARALGLGHLEAGEWLVVWRYEVSLVARYTGPLGPSLFRPTVLEAGDNPSHFPPPPEYPFGITMSLEKVSDLGFREVLHPCLKGKDVADACTGRLLRIEERPLESSDSLSFLRQRHRKRLARETLGPKEVLQGWLDRHPAAP